MDEVIDQKGVMPMPDPMVPNPYVQQPGVASGNNTPILKRCSGKNPATHEYHAELPVSEFFKLASRKDGLAIYCKQCQYEHSNRCKRGKRKALQIERGFIPEQQADIQADITPGKASKKDKELVSSTFILTEAKTLYFATPPPKLEQKIKLLELMAKYSPEMKNAKPQDKVALMAAMMESLAKEQVTDAIAIPPRSA